MVKEEEKSIDYTPLTHFFYGYLTTYNKYYDALDALNKIKKDNKNLGKKEFLAKFNKEIDELKNAKTQVDNYAVKSGEVLLHYSLKDLQKYDDRLVKNFNIAKDYLSTTRETKENTEQIDKVSNEYQFYAFTDTIVFNEIENRSHSKQSC
jgi:DNA repair ATPase RecN